VCTHHQRVTNSHFSLNCQKSKDSADLTSKIRLYL
jgi:hypothetical protein